ncbi:hypothetical protein MKX42_23680 [Paenibacillus sp. FSL R7-0204]|uniref:hypothetical protein n=1 Tax=Paenibacillus sp. FSL R7-0204 TaxID=2921675 RepID=UPI0030FC72E4
MKIRNKIDSSGVTTVHVERKIIYSPEYLDEMKSAFETFKILNILIAESFEALEWGYVTPIYNNPYRIIFDLEVYKELNLVLRIYAIARIINKISPATVALEQRYLKRIIMKTNGFKNSEPLKAILNSVSKPEASRIARSLKVFLSFYPLSDNQHQYNEIIESTPSYSHENRSLPDFQDVLFFDNCIDDYFFNSDNIDTRRYLPILLWWRLTNTLPMRISAFLLLDFDCIKKTEDNLYWLKTKRIKEEMISLESVEGDEIQGYPDETYQIDARTYNLILDFKNLISFLNIESKYLFSIEFYLKIVKPNSRVNPEKAPRMDRSFFNPLLQKFQTEIIKERYGHEYNTALRPGDTRHLAIINLFLQGFNPLSIARMAGHKSIMAQEGYYNHAQHYTDSFIYHLASKKFEDHLKQKSGHGIIGNARTAYDKGRVVSEMSVVDLKQVDYGYCGDNSDQFPNNCAEDCRYCSFYIFKPNLDDFEKGTEWLSSYSRNLGSLVERTLKEIFQIGKQVNKINQVKVDQTLTAKATYLSALMEHKATVDAKSLEAEW